jgi:lactoylglutathione lyase
MSEHEVKMIVLSTDDLDESIRFYSETLGMSLKFRDGAHFAALDGGPITLALATAVDHPIPGQVVLELRLPTSTPRRRPLRPVAAAS